MVLFFFSKSGVFFQFCFHRFSIFGVDLRHQKKKQCLWVFIMPKKLGRGCDTPQPPGNMSLKLNTFKMFQYSYKKKRGSCHLSNEKQMYRCLLGNRVAYLNTFQHHKRLAVLIVSRRRTPRVEMWGCFDSGPRWSTLSYHRELGCKSRKMWSRWWWELKTSRCGQRRRVNVLKSRVFLNLKKKISRKRVLHKRNWHTAINFRARHK